MNAKKILIVSGSFFPVISPRSFRTTELAKELARQGHEVFVYIPFKGFDYSDYSKANHITFKNIGELKWKAIILKGCTIEQKVRRVIRRCIQVLFEWPEIELMFKVSKILQREIGYDILISIAVPHPIHWGVAWARSNNKSIAKNWVADCGDPYMFARLDRFKKPFYFKFLEMNFCRECDFISIPFEEMRFQFYPQFKSKIIVIPQGYNFQEIHVFTGQTSNVKPTFIFAGSIIPGKRDLTLLLDFLSSLSTDFLFKVYTQQKEWFNKFKITLGMKLELYDYVERSFLVYEMSKADFLLNVDTELDSHSNVEAVPSKLIDYAIANRPILNINSSYLDKEMVLEFLNRNYSKQRIVDISNYDIKRVSNKFLELFN
jgi:glycosyltransferase involved in cell wall biosynthesis